VCGENDRWRSLFRLHRNRFKFASHQEAGVRQIRTLERRSALPFDAAEPGQLRRAPGQKFGHEIRDFVAHLALLFRRHRLVLLRKRLHYPVHDLFHDAPHWRANVPPAVSFRQAGPPNRGAIGASLFWAVGLAISMTIYHRAIDDHEERAWLWAGLAGWYAFIFPAPVWSLLIR